MSAHTPLRVTMLMWVGSLFALLGMERFFVDPLSSLALTVAVFVVQVAPLLIVVPIVLRGGARGPLLLTLVSILYFVHGVWQWSAPDLRIFGVLEVIFSLGAFVTAWILLKVMPPDTAQRGERDS